MYIFLYYIYSLDSSFVLLLKNYLLVGKIYKYTKNEGLVCKSQLNEASAASKQGNSKTQGWIKIELAFTNLPQHRRENPTKTMVLEVSNYGFNLNF